MSQNQERYELAIAKGNEFLDNKAWKDAVTAFRVAIAEFNNRPEAYAGLGKACLGLKQYPRALDCYKLAARLTNGDSLYLLRVADIQERTGQLSEAAATYLAAGEYDFQHKSIDEAIGNWERAIRLDSNLLGAHQRLAMIFQRQARIRDAVREYVAIARILDGYGNKEKARQVCEAALRLDPNNEGVLTAMKLIEEGEEAFPEPEDDEDELSALEQEVEAEEEGDSLFGAVRQMAQIFESEQKEAGWKNKYKPNTGPIDIVTQTKTVARRTIDAEMMREEDESDYEYNGLIKLERDALFGKALDYEQRGEYNNAIGAYEQALDGGSDFPAAYFLLGLLHQQTGQTEAAYQSLAKAAEDAKFSDAARELLSQLG